MVTIVFRTLLIYVLLLLTMRLMGKRQIGELEVTELVTTLLVSEIASIPITNQDIPILHAAIPILLLLILEVLSSWLLLRFPALKPILSASPTLLIRDGSLCQRALSSNRVSVEELMGEIRQQGYSDLSQIDEAILETSGKLTVLPKPAFVTPNASQLGLSLPEDPIFHVVFYAGRVNKAGLSLIGKDPAWLRRELARRHISAKSLYCATANRSGELTLVEKEQTP